ncbi:MAG: substrate-binding domain-containing protein [Bifidobacterium bifidum]
MKRNWRIACLVYRIVRASAGAVPQELSVIGFDDVPRAAKIGLTTLHQDPFNIGDMLTDHQKRCGAGVEAGGGERTFRPSHRQRACISLNAVFSVLKLLMHINRQYLPRKDQCFGNYPAQRCHIVP